VSAAIDTHRLGRRYGRRWALRDYDVTIPRGRVVGLVGTNGSGKSTLLHLIVGLLGPSEGSVDVLGQEPGSGSSALARVGFVAQDAPLYPSLSVADHLRLGRHLNPDWDGQSAQRRVERLGLDPGRRAGQLSGGQRAQLALTLAVAKRPELLVLDEPVASLDPIARREFLADLMEAVVDEELTVVLSSHLLTDVERVCDHVVVLAAGRVGIAGDVDELLATHKLLVGPPRDPESLPADQTVIQASHTTRQTTLLIRSEQPVLDPAWATADVGLEELVLAYMAAGPQPDRPARPRLEVSR